MLSEGSPRPEVGSRATPISLLICNDAITDVLCFVLPTHVC
jgi:hypothetical protein